MRKERLAAFTEKHSNEDFLTRLLGGITSHDHVAHMKAKLEALAKQIEDTNNSTSTSGTCPQSSGDGKSE